MTLTLIGWILVVFSVAAWVLLIAPARGAKTDLLSRLRIAGLAGGQQQTQSLRGSGGLLLVAAAAFLSVAGIGAATSYVGSSTDPSGSGEALSGSSSGSESDSELADLNDYARTIKSDDPAPKASDAKLLPDVNTMIERLAARLETNPNDVNGWRMLGWSYFNMERYPEAVGAYAKAAELEPGNAEIKRLHEEAKAKASGTNAPKTAATSPTEPAVMAGHGPTAEQMAKSEAMPASDRDAQIRSMVDGLAARLESSPRDAEGWARLMRSRVVLGEKEVAVAAYRKALDVFKDDAAASTRITDAATELGLKAE